jgi:hypothetical protein
MLSKSLNQIQKVGTEKDEVHNKNDVGINLKSTSIINVIELDKKEKIEIRSSSRIQIIKNKVSTEFIEVRNTEKNKSMSKLMKRSIKKELKPLINDVKSEKMIMEGKNDTENMNKNEIEEINGNEKEKSGDWWRDEVEITDQNPISPPSPPSLPTPPRHLSSPFSSPFSSSFLRTPKTKSRTVKKDSKRNSLSLSKDSFNSDATTASVTPVINRIPRTQEDYVMNMNRHVGEEINESGNDNKNDNRGENYALKNIVRNENDSKGEGGVVGDEGEEGEGKETEKEVKFTSSSHNSQNQNQSDINDNDFSNFFISTFSSSVNSSDNEKN